MAQRFLNNFSTVLAASISSSDTTITLQSTAGMAALSAGDYYMLTLYKRSGADELEREIVKVTSLSGNVATVLRGQEGTAAFSAPAGTFVEARLTAGALDAVAQQIGALSALVYAGL